MADDANVVPPPPYTIPIYDRSGQVSQPWSQWFQRVWLRIGKDIALNNVELENIQQQDLSDIEDDITAIEAVNATQNVNIANLQAEVEGLKLAPLA